MEKKRRAGGDKNQIVRAGVATGGCTTGLRVKGKKNRGYM